MKEWEKKWEKQANKKDKVITIQESWNTDIFTQAWAQMILLGNSKFGNLKQIMLDHLDCHFLLRCLAVLTRKEQWMFYSLTLAKPREEWLHWCMGAEGCTQRHRGSWLISLSSCSLLVWEGPGDWRQMGRCHPSDSDDGSDSTFK